MMKRMRAALLTLTMVVSTAGLVLTGSAPAEAASCSGTLIRSYPVTSKTNGQKIAELNIYYNSANGGTNSACMTHTNAAYGKNLSTGVRIWKCGSYYNCNTVDPLGGGWAANDEGLYAYYAGPVKVTGTKSRCIAVYAYITDPFNTNRYSEITGINIGCAATPSIARL